MMRFIRYALTTFCFAASVGCLLIWWRSMTTWDMTYVTLPGTSRVVSLQSHSATLTVGMVPEVLVQRYPATFATGFKYQSTTDLRGIQAELQPVWEELGVFGAMSNCVYLPLWYASLIFGLAGVGVLRFRRQYSIRSALICVSVVAVLSGMVVIL